MKIFIAFSCFTLNISASTTGRCFNHFPHEISQVIVQPIQEIFNQLPKPTQYTLAEIAGLTVFGVIIPAMINFHQKKIGSTVIEKNI